MIVATRREAGCGEWCHGKSAGGCAGGGCRRCAELLDSTEAAAEEAVAEEEEERRWKIDGGNASDRLRTDG